MVLLNTNAQHIFWLGRYLSRTQFLCSHFPFLDDEAALNYAHAFCLPAFDASSLNELILDAKQPASFRYYFKQAQEKIQKLRGVLSASAYSELSRLIKTTHENAAYICDVVHDCEDVLEAESPDIFLFFSLGQSLDQLDQQLRLAIDTQKTLTKIDYLVETLVEMGWGDLEEYWQQLRRTPSSIQFYQFSDHIHQLFEADL
ncbi:alpha-E domain-containing protein [Acinetobacter sp. RF14B]|uniref:alpha-E domain-containing protein n=1 Tax=Acinetobacter sp. RF14B TaxID=2650965 RepID=UPI001173FAF8|nr:alpha-E domain-containing protein [Acinetobacter sp. RF14B]TQR64706.1 hypothetical protein E2K52_06860 [Acinetobacter sp. RF14B]